MNSIYAFDSLSSIRIRELLDKAIFQCAEELRVFATEINRLYDNPPKPAKGLWAAIKWEWTTGVTFSNHTLMDYHSALHFLELARQGFAEDLANLSRINVALGFKPQHIGADQRTLDLIDKFTNADKIRERNEWLQTLLNTVK